MIAFPSMLLNPAKEAGISVPNIIKDDDLDKLNKEKYPHFYIYCVMQLGRRMPRPSSHWDNAKIIASIPEEKLKTITFPEIISLGFDI